MTKPIPTTPEEQRIEADLAAERNFVAAVLDTVGAMVVVFDTEGRIVRFNRACEDISGYTYTELLGEHAWERLIPSEDVAASIANFERICSGQLPTTYEDRWVAADRSIKRISWSVTGLMGSDGSINFIIATGIDITEQLAAEDKLRALARQSNSVLESVGDGIVGLDLKGCCTVVNPAAAKMLGYPVEELLGRTLHALVHHTAPDGTPYLESECAIMQSIYLQDDLRVSDDIFWRRDGTSFPVEYVVRPQMETTGADAGAQPVGVVIAFTDISERDALSRMKDEFISTVSHELRTPLTALRGALGLLSEELLHARPEKFKQMMEIAAANTERLGKLVNDILDIERINQGKAELHYAACSLEGLMRAATTSMELEAATANIVFTIIADGVEVYADPDRLQQALLNLISNAIKFSAHEDGSSTAVHLSAQYLSPDEAMIEVRDHGRGIPEDKLEEIFERFRQVDASDTRSRGGSGLGLAICRNIVTQHGGRIWATNAFGGGTTFHITLPVRLHERSG